MNNIKKIFFSVFIIAFINIALIKNYVYADVIMAKTINYSPLYYIAIIGVILIVEGISIFILKKIYNSNKLEQENNREEKGEDE